MLGLKADYDRDELADVIQRLRGVAGRLTGCNSFAAGANIDLEGKSPEFPFGFTLDFENTAVLDRYAKDEEHIKLGNRLLKLCGSGDNIVVYDLEVQG